MAELDNRMVLAELLAVAIRSCEREIADMKAALRRPEKTELRRIENTYAEGLRWRDPAIDDFARMVDARVVLNRNR